MSGQLVPGFVVPQLVRGGFLRDGKRQPKPAEHVATASLNLALDRPQRGLQLRHTNHMATGDQRRHAIQEEVDRPHRLRSGRRSISGLCRVLRSARATESAREHRSTDSFEVRLATQGAVERFELLGGIEKLLGGIEKHWRSATPATAGEDDPGPKPNH